jgi:hypothetical protein
LRSICVIAAAIVGVTAQLHDGRRSLHGGCGTRCGRVVLSRNNEVTATAVPAGTSRAPQGKARELVCGRTATPSFRFPTQSWCHLPRGSEGEQRSCKQLPLSPFSCRSASTDKRPAPSALEFGIVLERPPCTMPTFAQPPSANRPLWAALPQMTTKSALVSANPVCSVAKMIAAWAPMPSSS